MLVVGLGEAAAVLVGRAAELPAPDAAFERVLAGPPSAVLIGGEAGVGKSRLVSKFAGGPRPLALPGCCMGTAWSEPHRPAVRAVDSAARATPGHCSARAPRLRAALTAPGTADGGLARSAEFLLDRLRALAQAMDAVGPLQQAHRLTFAAESQQAGGPPQIPPGPQRGARVRGQGWYPPPRPHEAATGMARCWPAGGAGGVASPPQLPRPPSAGAVLA